MFFKEDIKSDNICKETKIDSAIMKIMKKWTKIICSKVFSSLNETNYKILFEIFIFLYTIADFWLGMNEKQESERRQLFNEIDSILQKYNSDNKDIIKKVFDNRIENYAKIIAKNNNTIDKQYFSLCRDYQLELIGKILEKNEYSFYDLMPKSPLDSSQRIYSYITISSVKLALLEGRNYLFTYMADLSGQDYISNRKQILINISKLKGFTKYNNVIAMIDRFCLNDIQQIYGNYKVDEGFELYEKDIYRVNSTYELYSKYIFADKKGQLIKIDNDKAEQNCNSRRFYEKIDCTFDEENLFEYFLFQVIMDEFINSRTWGENYHLITDLEAIIKYKKILENNKIINERFVLDDYPGKILDSECLYIGIFTSQHDGIFFKIVKVKPRQYFEIEYSVLLEKGKFADMII